MKKAFSHTELVSENKQMDHEVKIVQKQIVLAEKSLASLLKDFTNITVDLTRLHTRKMELREAILCISREESPVIQECLNSIANHMEVVLQSLNTNISVLQNKVIHPVSEKAKNCKETRTILDKCSDMKYQRTIAIKALGKRSAWDKHANSKAYSQTLLESTRQLNELTSEMIRFEKFKAEDLKLLLKTYMHSNLAYHVKAVEQYTKAYQAISLVDVDKHVEHFINSLTFPGKTERSKFVRWHSLTSLKS